MTYVNQNGYKEETSKEWLWSLLFGAFYFAYKGIWIHFVIYLILAIATGGVGLIFLWFIYPFFASTIVENHYLKNGWKREDFIVKPKEVKNDDMFIESEDLKNSTYYCTLKSCSSSDFGKVKNTLKTQYETEKFTIITTDRDDFFQLKKEDNSNGYVNIQFKNKTIDIEAYNVAEKPMIFKQQNIQSPNNADRLIELSRMLEKGLITEQEFMDLKKNMS